MDDKTRLSQQIDNALNHPELYKSVMICAHTPRVLQQLGLKDYPILMSQQHVRNCLHEKGKNPRWHGLDKSDLIGLVDQLQAPTLVMDSLNDDYSIITVTDTVDKDRLPIIATLRCYGEGQYELATVQSNYLTSVYGKDRFNNFLDKHVQENAVLYADKEKVQSLEQFSQLQLLQAYSFCFGSNKIIHQSSNVGQAQDAYYQAFQDDLYKSLVVEDATTNTLRTHMFIVGVDSDNERFIVFSDTNPDGYKLFAYPFEDALHNMNTIDGENNTTRIRTHKKTYVLQHVARLRDYIEYDLPYFYDRNPTKLTGIDTDCLPSQMDYISSISPSEFVVPELKEVWADKYARLQKSAKPNQSFQTLGLNPKLQVKKVGSLADEMAQAKAAANRQEPLDSSSLPPHLRQ